MSNNEVSRQVETREPLDINQTVAAAYEAICGMATCPTPTTEQSKHITHVVAAGAEFAAAVARALPEGKDQLIAFNNIEQAVLRVKHGILKRAVEVVPVVAP